MAKKIYETPMLDELENGPWPSFISGIKKLRDEHPDERIVVYRRHADVSYCLPERWPGKGDVEPGGHWTIQVCQLPGSPEAGVHAV